MADLVIVDYGMGNLRSVAWAVEQVAPKARVVVSSDVQVIRQAARVLVPGQGAMSDCMQQLQRLRLVEVLTTLARSRPFLGICIGLQMLFTHSEEGDVDCLGIFPGRVCRFPAPKDPLSLKVPHMGWNRVYQSASHPIWEGVSDGAYFYFVHSYYAKPECDKIIMATTRYGSQFACACAHENLFAVQFHPEKGAADGLRVLHNFMDWHP